MIYLMLKTHKETGLKYLCKCENRNPHKYKGSGTYWKEHLRRFGNSIKDITTEVLFETNDVNKFKEKALYYSNLWQVDINSEFANYILEQGDGGDTSKSEGYQQYLNSERFKKVCLENSERMKINNPIHNPEVAAKVHNRTTYNKISEALTEKKKSASHVEKIKAQAEREKEIRKQRISGEKNPTKRPEVRLKMKNKQKDTANLPELEFKEWLSKQNLFDKTGRKNSRVVGVLKERGVFEQYY